MTSASSDPKHCHDLGNALRAQGKLDEAVASYRQALVLKPDFAEARFELAATLHQRGELAEAIENYRNALSDRPDFVVAHYNLASALKTLGKRDEAVASYRKAIALKSDFVAAHFNIANTLRDLGRADEAVASYRKAIALKPDFAEAHNNLGLVFQAQGRLDQAADSYRKAIAIKPSFADPHNNLGTVLNALGLFDAAVASYRRALEINETPEFKTNFVRCIKHGVFVRSDAGVRHLVARAIAEPWGGKGELTRVGISLLKADRRIGDCIERAAKAWPRRLPGKDLYGPAGPTALANDPLLRALLENSPCCDIALERCLTSVRRAMLDAASAPDTGDDVTDETLSFYCAVARQCFINEYVFSCADEEVDQATSLREKFAVAMQSGKPVPPLSIAVVASYFPLLSLPGAESLVHLSYPAPVAALLAQQIVEPLEERRHRDSMPRLTTIENGVSSSVRQQYEENPYPRWLKLPPAGNALVLDEYLRQRFPHASLRPLGKGDEIDILIAGCGTGQESIAMAQQFPAARLLAVDLSLASLGYAKRKTREAGLANIEYAQADITTLRSIGRTFDVIVSVGVLHHLADSIAGLRELTLLLRSNGFMHLGLYSERARESVVAARKFIAEHGYASTAADIRGCRQDLIAAGSQFADLLASGDFYSMSECRDLLFHIQEHRFTLPQIKEVLEDMAFDFLGFSLDPEVARQYASRFPDDGALTNLDHWHDFESEFPRTFAGMYKFWVQQTVS
jgi:tetratricopeptide (TPR) repeat protein/2-polyprenyl-3-methyl-5-hydroxy-6-metoxy-1,4-benzoquinol methylase